uniref:DSPc domain-containing protein n=1 Tax=Elaeophora elaphi TaxID=1147741 RepID=A0A0R3RMI7_9BILA
MQGQQLAHLPKIIFSRTYGYPSFICLFNLTNFNTCIIYKFEKIFNLSKRRSDLGRLHSVVELGWPEELAPPLDRLCSICKLLENWLSANAENVVVIHCKGGCSRAAIVIAAYMHYITICSS